MFKNNVKKIHASFCMQNFCIKQFSRNQKLFIPLKIKQFEQLVVQDNRILITCQQKNCFYPSK